MVAWTLSSYIHQLRCLEAPPGPIIIRGPCDCDLTSTVEQVQNIRGPFCAYVNLAALFQ